MNDLSENVYDISQNLNELKNTVTDLRLAAARTTDAVVALELAAGECGLGT
jgi:hypothetical protein